MAFSCWAIPMTVKCSPIVSMNFLWPGFSPTSYRGWFHDPLWVKSQIIPGSLLNTSHFRGVTHCILSCLDGLPRYVDCLPTCPICSSEIRWSDSAWTSCQSIPRRWRWSLRCQIGGHPSRTRGHSRPRWRAARPPWGTPSRHPCHLQWQLGARGAGDKANWTNKQMPCW